jgi:hypothetical protein
MSRKKVFLGGTFDNSTWRDELIPLLTINHVIPDKTDWTQASRLKEETLRNRCDYALYVITPELRGSFMMSDVVECSYQFPKKTVFGLLREANGQRYDDFVWNNLLNMVKLVVENGGVCFHDLADIANYLNNSQNLEESPASNVEITSANGVEGHLLYNYGKKKYQFRVYNKDYNFIDYDIAHCDLLVKIIGEDASFYKVNDTYILDHAPETLGL